MFGEGFMRERCVQANGAKSQEWVSET